MASYEDTVLALNPVLFIRMDEVTGTVMADSSSFATDGEFYLPTFGMPSPIETDAGSHAIGGSVGKVLIADAPQADVRGTFSLQVWGYNTGEPSQVSHLITRNGQIGLSGGNWIAIDNNNLRFNLNFGGSDFELSYTFPVANRFYQGVGVRNGAVMSLYVDGVLVARRVDLPLTDIAVGGSPAWYFGSSGNQNLWLSVSTDEGVIFDTALSDVDVLAIYESAINQTLLNGFSNVIPTAVLYSDIPAAPVSFPFRHNWDTPLIERLTFKTNITRARTGVEEGGLVRVTPRRELELVQVIKNNDERKRLRAQLWAHQNAQWFIPVRQDVELLSAALTAGDTTVPVTTAYMDYEVGSYIGLRQLADDGSITHWEYQLITAVTSTTVECEPLTYDYRANLSHVYPARVALLDKSIALKGHAAEVEEVTIVARLLAENESATPARITTWHPTIKYRDYEVFDPRVWQSNDWDELRDYSVERELDDIDFDDGVFSMDADTPGAAETFSYRMKLSTRAEIAALLGWFYERAGSGRYLWVPSMQRDYDVLGVSTTRLTVEGTNYTDNFAGAEARRDLAFVYNDLSMQFRRVTDFADEPETLTLDANVPTLSNLKFVSILKFCRLEADSLEIAWETNTKATLAWRFRELTHSPEGTGVSSLSPSHSASFSRSQSASQSPSPSVSPSHSASPSTSASPSPSPSVSPSHSSSPSQSPSGSNSPSHSQSPSVSPSHSPSASGSPSISPSHSLSPSASVSLSPSGSVSPSGSTSPSHSVSPSHSASPST
jgi:hypothetical protein